MKIKKKYLVVILVVAIVVLGSIGGFVYYKHQDKVKKERLEEERIQKIESNVKAMNEKLDFFKKEELLEEPKDELEEYFNNLLVTRNKIESLEYKNVSLNDLSDMTSLKNRLENEDINTDIFDENIHNIIKKYTDEEREVILEVYNNCELVKNKDSLKNKANEYENKISKDLELVNYLESNKDKYYIKNSKLIYKTDDFKDEFSKYNTGIKIEKEVLGDITILMYHGVKDQAWGDTSLFVRVGEFEAQMKYLSENGYTPIFLSEINNAKNIDKPVLITFDDGYLDVYESAFPILKKYNFKANFYIITGWVGGDVFVTEDMIKEMDASGLIEIGSHTVNHTNLGKSSEETIDMELKTSKEYLENLLGKKINTIAYPFGGYNGVTLKVAKKYYDYAVTTVTGKEYSSKLNRLELKRYKVGRGCSINTFKTYLV